MTQREPTRIPIYDETAPIACTIGAEDVPERIALVERLRWDGPPAVSELLDQLGAWLRHERDLPDIAGLL